MSESIDDLNLQDYTVEKIVDDIRGLKPGATVEVLDDNVVSLVIPTDLGGVLKTGPIAVLPPELTSFDAWES